jgi:hypothetical protein
MRYRHYKGGIYELVSEAQLEADHTPVIVYRDAAGAVWVRPRDAFFDTVTLDGMVQPRFAPLDDASGTIPATATATASD